MLLLLDSGEFLDTPDAIVGLNILVPIPDGNCRFFESVSVVGQSDGKHHVKHSDGRVSLIDLRDGWICCGSMNPILSQNEVDSEEVSEANDDEKDANGSLLTA